MVCLLVCACILALAIVWSRPRYQFLPTSGGMLRGDVQTGRLVACVVEGTEVVCR